MSKICHLTWRWLREDSAYEGIWFAVNSSNADLPPEISCQAVSDMRSTGVNFLLLDCRESNEVDIVSISHSLWIPMSEIETRVSELDEYRNDRIVVYCHIGGRSMAVTNWLREQGFEGTQSMTGGVDQWAREIDQSLPRY